MTEVNSVEAFLSALSSIVAPDEDHWFRGLSSDGWDLSGSVFRTPSLQANEKVLLKRFIQEARRYIADVPATHWDWVFLAQHHQVPTRLLDWSENPLVALFFAAQDHLDIPADPATARDGRVWTLKPTVLNEKGGFSFTSPRDIPLFGFDKELDEYDPFDGSGHRRPPVAGLASRNFSRINAQWGTFTVTNSPEALDLLPDNDEFLEAFVVPVADKSHIRQQLQVLGLEDRTIYPDLFRLGKRLSEVFG